MRDYCIHVKHDLFGLGGALAFPAGHFIENKLLHMDVAITHYNAGLPPLKKFILPGGTRAVAQCHVARRTERDFVALAQL